jgi:hypothetical protein
MLEHHADLRTHGGDGAIRMRAEATFDLIAIDQLAVDPDATLFCDHEVNDEVGQRGLDLSGRGDDVDDTAAATKVDSRKHASQNACAASISIIGLAAAGLPSCVSAGTALMAATGRWLTSRAAGKLTRKYIAATTVWG